jgi:hypothetical protein
LVGAVAAIKPTAKGLHLCWVTIRGHAKQATQLGLTDNTKESKRGARHPLFFYGLYRTKFLVASKNIFHKGIVISKKFLTFVMLKAIPINTKKMATNINAKINAKSFATGVNDWQQGNILAFLATQQTLEEFFDELAQQPSEKQSPVARYEFWIARINSQLAGA